MVSQSTMYYASGVPMAQSFGRDKQPYLYNGKEFVEAHGWNTYDYGFRGYYAPIGRFTSIDPLAEQTPWQSPYSYAGNRFVNAIDWMGLGGITGFSHSDGTCHWVAIDGEGTIVGLDLEHWDKGVYEVDDFWDGSYWDLLRYAIIGDHMGIGPESGWQKGTNIKGKYNSGGGYYNSELGYYVSHGTIPREDAKLLVQIFQKEPSLIDYALRNFTTDVINEFLVSYIYNKNIDLGLSLKFISNGTAKAMTKAFVGLTYIEAGAIIYSLAKNGFNYENVSEALSFALTLYFMKVASGGPAAIIGLLETGASLGLGVGSMIGIGYLFGTGLMEIQNSINSHFYGWEWMGYYYGFK